MLADKSVHQIPWPQGKTPQETWQEAFCLTPPALQYNRGELHNLKVKRGTLTAEDRFMINDHIIQTILMLQRLPYPKHLQGVPEIAGGHHERMDGKGYPRGIEASQLSVPARIMAIADVFEALTSNDRPYKKAKSLQECIAIMTDMATSGHIDPKLYLLFCSTTFIKLTQSNFFRWSSIKIALSILKSIFKSAGVFTGRLLEHHDRKAR